jgi:hypothetical protein
MASARAVHAAPAASAPGFLNLVATPSAAVFEGSEPLGLTPLMARSLPPGTHRLVLVPSGGGPERTIVVQIRSGETYAASVRWP